MTEQITTPAPGSHLFRPVWYNTIANISLPTNSTVQFIVEEIVRQSANNGTS